MLAHDPGMLLGLVAGVVLLLMLLNALWYWLVCQVGFMLAAIGTRVERWRKVLLPFVLVPVAGLVTLCLMVLMVVQGAPEEGASLPACWSWLGGVLMVALLLGIPYVIGRCMLRFSVKRSLLTAVCQALVYSMVPFGSGYTVKEAPSDTIHSINISTEEMHLVAPAEIP